MRQWRNSTRLLLMHLFRRQMDHSSTIDSILWPSNLPQSKTRTRNSQSHRALQWRSMATAPPRARDPSIDRVNPLLPSKYIKMALVYICMYKKRHLVIDRVTLICREMRAPPLVHSGGAIKIAPHTSVQHSLASASSAAAAIYDHES